MWWQGLAELLRGAAHLVLPSSCLLCSRSETDEGRLDSGLCDACRRSLSDDPHEVCPHCATTVGPFSDTTRGCGLCRSRSFAFNGAVRLGTYQGLLRLAVLQVKTSAGELLAERLGTVFAEIRREQLSRYAADLVVPIPLHWRRRWYRGYNQAAAIALEAAQVLNLACEPGWLRRVKSTPQQVQPSASAREANVRGAFRASRRARFQGRTVLLIDDVMTTGSTMSEAARVVRQAGATRVVAAILARAE